MASLRRPRLPWLLKVLVWLYLSGAVFRVGSTIGKMARGEDIRISHAILALYTGWASWQVLRGKRGGIDALVWAGYLGIAFVALFVGNAIYTGTTITPLMGSVAALTVANAWYLRRCRARIEWVDEDEPEPGSYEDWVKSPEFREATAQWFAMRDAQIEADRKNPPDPRAIVADLLDSEDPELARHRLQEMPERALPAIVEALGNPRFQEDEEALETLLGLLPTPAPAEAAPALAQCCLRFDGAARGRPLRLLASTAAPEFAEVLAAGLAHEDTADATAEGLASAFASGHRPHALVARIQPQLRALLTDAERAATAAKALLALDEKQTVAHLLSELDTATTPDAAQLAALQAAADVAPDVIGRALQSGWQGALATRQLEKIAILIPIVRPPTADLTGLAAELSPAAPGDRDATQTLLAALRELVRREDPAADRYVRAAMEEDDARISEGAAELLCVLHGLGESGWIDWTRELTTHQRYACSLQWADSYTCNGGFIQALLALNDENMHALLPAAEHVGPPEIAAIWRQVVEAAFPDGIPGSHADREALVGDAFDRLEPVFDPLETTYYATKHRQTASLARFLVDHKAEMREALQE